MSGHSANKVSLVAEYASPELTESEATGWRGYVDQWDPVDGIRGWVLAPDNPERPIVLELVLGDEVLDVVETAYARPDIERIVGVRVRPGFRFKASVFGLIARSGSGRRDLVVSIRISGTSVRLPPADVPTTVGKLVDAWQLVILNDLRHQDPNVNDADRVSARLASLRGQAAAFKELPLRPNSELEVGRLDAVYIASEGQVWFTGWMKRGLKPEFYGIVVDRVKFPLGAAIIQYERQDLSSNCVGVVGVMETDWIPPLISQEFFLYIGEGVRLQLRADNRTKMLRAEEFLAAWDSAQSVALRGDAEAIGELLRAKTSWMADSTRVSGIAAEGALDRLFVLPGFGCIVEGWAISPAKRIRTFAMKIGGCVLDAEASSTYFRPRPDLNSVFGGRPTLIGRAGFVAVFRGKLPSRLTGAPLLRVLHDDGTSVVHRFDPGSLQLLDVVVDGPEILRLYPALRQESFYRAFLRAVRQLAARRMQEPLALVKTRVSRALVIRLPSTRNNLALCFDEIVNRLGSGEIEFGICLVADRTQNLGEAKLLFEELRSSHSVPLSLFCIEDSEAGLIQLPFLLGQIGAERFVYVGQGLLLTTRGWEHAAQSLARSGHELDFFEIIDESGGPDRIYGSRSAACFGWSMAALLEWAQAYGHSLRGVQGTSGLPESGEVRTLAGAGIRLERPKTSRLADLIDEDLLSLQMDDPHDQ